MRRAVENVFFSLLRFEINQTALSEEVKNLITAETLPALFKLSKRHDLAHLIGDALDKNCLFPNDTEVKKRFIRERNMAVYRYEQLQYELEQVCEVLTRAQIVFIPLKGSVIRRYYPEPWMRTSCDIDILVKKSDLDIAREALKRELEYHEEEESSSHDISFYAPSGVHLELHHALAEGGSETADSVLYDVWDNIENGQLYEKTMTAEMFYFYHIAHMAKHFEIGGCGVRPFLDVYFLQQKCCYHTESCLQLLQKGGLLKFANAVEETAGSWFGEHGETEISKEIQEYILYAGMYADTENRVAVQHIKSGGRIRYLCSRIFLPYEQLKVQYPNLEKYKLLFPFYQVKRWCRLLFGKDSRNVSRELKANTHLKDDKKARITKLLEGLGL